MLVAHYISLPPAFRRDPSMPSHIRRVTRLFVERELSGETLELDERDAHYLGHVLRLASGDELIVFNGRGIERHATVASLQRRGALLALGAPSHVLPESPLELLLLQALPKSDAMDLIVQKATELGVHAVVPMYTEFSVVKLDAERSSRRVDHWRKIAQGACEQSGRHSPPRIAAPAPLVEALEAIAAPALRVALDPTASSALPALAPTSAAQLVIAIGPEGGFGAADWRRLDGAGFTRATLGPRVLRAETAAFAACAVAQSLWGDFVQSRSCR
jgi:16S rRNA (uracil1498-N3)-methyltransferase